MEAVSSSAIEGTNGTLDELLSLEETEDDNATDAAKQVRDYALTLDALIPHAKQNGHKIFTSELVKDLHRSVMRGDARYEDAPGDLRNRVVWIGGRGDISYSSYNPAPPDDVPECLEESMAYMRCEDMYVMTQSLITRIAVAHAHFEAVHPFRDGNGRVGRLLIPLMMAAEGCVPLYLSSYIAERKDAYYAALKMAQQKLEWYHLIGFLAEAVTGTVNELLATRQALKTLANMWSTRRSFRQGSTAMKALHLLPDYLVITVKRLAQLSGVSIPAATTAIENLVEAKILTERTGYARNRVWMDDGRLLRLPQEDLCQALGVPSSQKYQSDGGPDAKEIIKFMSGSDNPLQDQASFLKSQILFWLIGATDGHAKNFSVFLRPGNGFQLTPFYDVLSVQPVFDGKQITKGKYKLAMSVGKGRHYRIDEVLGRHFIQTAKAANLGPTIINQVISEILDCIPAALDKARAMMPDDFAEEIYESIKAGVIERSRFLDREFLE